MLDFPSSPTNGQVFNNWRFDGTKWVPNSGALSLPDAPSDGHTYGRDNAAWNSVDGMIAPVSATANAALNDAGRNLLQNPVFTISQRGAGAFTTVNGQYTADRWRTGGVTDAVSFTVGTLSDAQRSAIGDDSAAFSLVNAFTGNAAAGAYNSIQQPIENVRRLSGKTVTVSLTAFIPTGMRLGINLWQNFGTGGSPSAGGWAQATGIALSGSNAWQRYTATFTVPSISGKTVGTNGDSSTNLTLAYSSGANFNAAFGNIGVQSGTIQIWGVQLEYGSVATPLDYGGSPADQLRQCQRYYQVGQFALSGYAGAGSGFAYAMMPPVAMRAAPTVTTSGTATSNTGAITAAAYGSAINFSAVGTATGPAAIQGSFQLSADL